MEFLVGGEEDRGSGGEHPGIGDLRGQRRSVEPVEELLRISAVADDPHPALLHHHQHQALRAERRHDLFGQQLRHVPDACGLGEGHGQMCEVVQGHRPDHLLWTRPLPGGRGGRTSRTRALGPGGGDVHADPVLVRVQLEEQTHIGRAQRREGRRKAGDDRGPVAVLDDEVAQPGQRLPGAPAQEPGGLVTDQVGAGRVDEGDPAVEVQGAAAQGQPLGEVERRGGLGRIRDPRLRRADEPGLAARRPRMAAVARALLHARGGPADERRDRGLLPRAELRRVPDGPQKHHAAPRLVAAGDRCRGEQELVREDQPQPGVPAGHLLLAAAQPDQPPLPDGVGHRDRFVQGDARPRSGDLRRRPCHQPQPQDPLARRQQVDQPDGGAGLQHETGEGPVQLLRPLAGGPVRFTHIRDDMPLGPSRHPSPSQGPSARVSASA